MEFLRVKKWIWITMLVFAVMIVFGIIVYINALEPLNQAESKAIEIAKQKISMKEVTDFTLYNGSDSYYIVKGVNSNGNNIIVWIPEEDNNKVIVREEKDGISKEEAIQKLNKEKNPQEILTVKLGMENNIPLWEIFYRSNENLINYYYVDFESGEWLKDIQNL